jgi:hypothetical protein
LVVIGNESRRELVAEGSRSVVFAVGSSSVIKVPLPGTPSTWMAAEAVYSKAVGAVGAPAPAMLGCEQVDGATAIRFSRVDGSSLWDVAQDQPRNALEFGAELAAVHLQLRSLPVPILLPELHSRIVAKLHRAQSVLLDELPDLLRLAELLSQSATHTVMCHGDLHPKNVLISADGPVLVDWFDASRGPWIADVARTVLLLEMGVGEGSPRPLWLDDFQQGYLAAVNAAVSIDPLEMRRWRVVCAAARLAEGVLVDASLELVRRELDLLKTAEV